MRADIHGDELLVVLDVNELPTRATARSLVARLPRSAPDIATEVVRIMDAPKPDKGPVTVRSVTVKLVRTEVVASETLMLDEARDLFT